MKTAMRKVATALAPLWATRWLRRSGTPVFMLHRVLPEGEEHTCYDPEMVTSTELFDAFLAWIKHEYRVVPLDDIAARRATANGKPVCALTFDDGWLDTYEHAFPLLQRHGVPATVFLPTAFIGSTRRFWQEKLWYCLRAFAAPQDACEALVTVARALPWCPQPPVERNANSAARFAELRRVLLARPSHEAEEFAARLEVLAPAGAVPATRAFMNWEEVRVMRDAGVCFGSHTVHHTLLTRCDPESVRAELEGSQRTVAEQLGSAPAGFSYPWGGSCELIAQEVKERGYEYAVITGEKLAHATGPDNPFSVPRVSVNSNTLRGAAGEFAERRTSLYVASRSVASNGHTRVGTRKLRVAFVADQIHYWDAGTEQQICKLITALDRDFFAPEIYLFNPPLALVAEDFPCPVHLVNPPPGRMRRLDILRQLTALFRRQRPDIVQNFFAGATFYGTLAARAARVPIVVNSKRNMSARDYSHWAQKLVSRWADHWQCNSRVIREVLKTNAIPGSRIEILPNGIDLERFSVPTPEEKLAARRRLDIPPGVPVIAAVANLRPVKDVPTVIEAARFVAQQEAGVQFLLIGDGPLRNEIAGLIARERLGHTVRLLGMQPDVRPFLAAADMAVLASRSEGSPNSVLEYMAMGVPAVVSEIPATRELVDDVLFRPGDAADLAAKLLALWRDPQRRARLAGDYRERASRYSLEACARRAQAYYLKLAAEYMERAA